MPPTHEIHMALNGRVGRRVGCVLNRETQELEMLDLDADEEDEEMEEDDAQMRTSEY